jgi:hypothetical protein
MRYAFVPFAGALVLGALVHAGCAEQRNETARGARPTAPVGTSAVLPERPPPAAPQPSPPVAGETLRESAPPSGPETNTPPPAPGTTEEQPAPDEGEERTQATKVVAEASSQIDRLQRMQSMSTEAHRDDLDNAVYDLERKRERVLQD